MSSAKKAVENLGVKDACSYVGTWIWALVNYARSNNALLCSAATYASKEAL